MNYKLFFAIVFLWANNIGFTQSTSFSKEQFSQFEGQAKDYIKDFTKTVKDLANPSSSCDKPCLNDKIEGTIGHFKTGATVQILKSRSMIPINIFLTSILQSKIPLKKITILCFYYYIYDPTKITEIKNKNGKIEYHVKAVIEKFVIEDINPKEPVENFVLLDPSSKEFDIIVEKHYSASSGNIWKSVMLGDVFIKKSD